ncbi:MAG: hypothetical protein EOP45_11090 [Sphingobacteriaceae bacterium]|nr:MAG: hypothetical protein EOP45_11090 [Sphingobacteriaceae bacterium]
MKTLQSFGNAKTCEETFNDAWGAILYKKEWYEYLNKSDYDGNESMSISPSSYLLVKMEEKIKRNGILTLNDYEKIKSESLKLNFWYIEIPK